MKKKILRLCVYTLVCVQIIDVLAQAAGIVPLSLFWLFVPVWTFMLVLLISLVNGAF